MDKHLNMSKMADGSTVLELVGNPYTTGSSCVRRLTLPKGWEECLNTLSLPVRWDDPNNHKVVVGDMTIQFVYNGGRDRMVSGVWVFQSIPGLEGPLQLVRVLPLPYPEHRDQLVKAVKG